MQSCFTLSHCYPHFLHVDSHHSSLTIQPYILMLYEAQRLCASLLHKQFFSCVVVPQFNYLKSFPLLDHSLETPANYLAHLLQHPTLDTCLVFNFQPIRLTHLLVTVCILLQVLANALAKFFLVSSSLCGDTPFQAHILSQQPSESFLLYIALYGFSLSTLA